VTGVAWACRRLDALLDAYRAALAGNCHLAAGDRRLAALQLREFVRFHPELADLIPGEVWVEIYRVRAAGTVPP
jgi:hypothetical protein